MRSEGPMRHPKGTELMAVVAVVTAGGVGRRMTLGDIPKQFVEVGGMPVIIHTLRVFDEHPMVDGIVISCLAAYVSELEKMIENFGIAKVTSIVIGGSTGQESIYNALVQVENQYPPDTVVLIHDAVRPLIHSETITGNIESVRAYGSAVTSSLVSETVVTVASDEYVASQIDRATTRLARAPQGFLLEALLECHRLALSEGRNDYIDSCSLALAYGLGVRLVEGPPENIKLTTLIDLEVFAAIQNRRDGGSLNGAAK
jgi:2-C-methyl-D-erythritol 4-phosphate cytidylyltransferase